ncbi:glycosyltransferase [Duganella radicis]|uniref:Glycosyltransferase n=1 Tax=Duganella radicis TaxID=551988 RepID=A0A6L6PMY4_9BURK|nr:glycosyltransferase [Duganella radicis]MTV39991.1 glycosyltransferase [Duganella radicis]
MDNHSFVLSICIPSYNRAPYLQQTLDSIVSQPAFTETNDIEVVISDNGSEDETQAVAARYVAAFPDKIQYHRHDVTISPDMNFKFVLEQGRGLYLKLHNDNLLVLPGSLAELVKVYRATAAEMPVVFFTNGNHAKGQAIEALNNMSEFVQRVSFMSTWIGGFGMWRAEFHAMPDFARNQHLRLVQTDVILRLISLGKRAIVLFGHYFSGVPTGRKGNYKVGGYNIAEVFGKNYLSLLKPYVASGQLDRGVYEHEKKLALFQQILPYYFDPNNDYQKSGFFAHMQDYVNDAYFYQAVANLQTDVPPALIAQHTAAAAPPPAPEPAPTPEAQRAAYNAALAQQWRALNPHNETILQTAHGLFNFDKLSVGRRTYGGITLWTFGDPREKLTIGHFCSIADDVKFLLGGNHPHDGVSTFPFLTKYFGQLEAKSKGAITVGDDVWIGYNSTILSGVTIGQGAVIAAGSTVTRDVPPYAIVGGNPARLLKYRFEPAVVEKMLKLDYSRVSDEAIMASRDILYQPITPENADAIVAALMR